MFALDRFGNRNLLHRGSDHQLCRVDQERTTMTYGNEGLQRLKEELDRTAVISSEFKKEIMGWALHAVHIAHESGQEKGKADEIARREATLAVQ